MKTYPWQVTHYLPKNMNSILDVGCNVGELLQAAAEHGYKVLLGIEINLKAVKIAQLRLSSIPNCSVVQGSADQIPFKDSSSDVVTCCEVLEHIPSNLRPIVMSEIFRVLNPGGTLIITVPAAGWFAFLDPANFRLKFPRAFKLLSIFVKGNGREAGFEGQKHGIVWHHHFHYEEIASLLITQGFDLQLTRGRGAFLTPVMNWLEFPFYRYEACDNFIFKVIRYIHDLDVACNYGRKISYNLLIVAKKPIT